MRRLRIIAAVTLAALAVIVILQNTAPVETRLLFATVTMPRAALLILTTLAGFALGLLTSYIGRRRSGGG